MVLWGTWLWVLGEVDPFQGDLGLKASIVILGVSALIENASSTSWEIIQVKDR